MLARTRPKIKILPIVSQKIVQPTIPPKARPIVLVGESPIRSIVAEQLRLRFQVIMPDRYSSRQDNNVLFVVLHKDSMLPYQNHWLQSIAKRSKTRALGLISLDQACPIKHDEYNNYVTAMLYNDFLPLKYGYYPVKFGLGLTNHDDIERAYRAIIAASNDI